ncbi:MAG: sigma-70 family RNA polymerase sigma factor [Alphaproteobacteria bacterium]
MLDREREWAGWMAAARGGDPAAYRRLLEALAPVLRGLARRGLERAGAGSGDVEDVVQETLLAIHLKRDTWNDAEPIGPWVFAIARYKLTDALRRRGRRTEIAIDLVADSLADDKPPPAGESGDVERMLRHLDGRMRDVVRAVSLEGATAAEAARRLGMTEGAVRVTLHRGLKALAARFRSTWA